MDGKRKRCAAAESVMFRATSSGARMVAVRAVAVPRKAESVCRHDVRESMRSRLDGVWIHCMGDVAVYYLAGRVNCGWFSKASFARRTADGGRPHMGLTDI